MGKNLILGTAFGTPYLYAALPFALSARIHHPSDRIVLLTDSETPVDAVTLLKKMRIELRAAFTGPRDTNFHIQRRRYREYFRLLMSLDCEMIFMADTRDLIFQSNVFAGFSNGDPFLALFEEDHILGEEVYNREWITAFHGKEAFQELAPYHVICSGTTLGTHKAVLAYLAYMVAIIENNSKYYHWNGDQGHHNYLIRKGLLSHPSQVFPNTNPHVHHFSLKENCDLNSKYQLTKHHYLALNSGVKPAAIHQYNRNETVVIQFLKNTIRVAAHFGMAEAVINHLNNLTDYQGILIKMLQKP